MWVESMHLVGVEDIVLSPVLFPKETGAGGFWELALGRRKVQGTGKTTALYLGGEQKCTESCRLSYCTGIIMAAIFARLFNNVNLATAWYYNISPTQKWL